MKFNKRWLEELIDIKISVDQLINQLTMAGLEIDKVTPVAADFSNVFIGQIVKISTHPNADKLHICEVNVGEATPLQIVRMMAAVANGGLLVTPHLASRLGLPELAEGQSTAELSELTDDPIQIPPPTPIPGLEASALATIREGLERVVSDPDGTAHGSVRLDSIPIAGKTGTAQTGSNRSPHAWFAGYVPADKPKFAFVVVLEHSGDAGEVAGPVAKRLVLRMQQLGYIGP